MNLIHLVIGFQNKSLILTNKLLFHNHTIKIPFLEPPKRVTTNLPKMILRSNKFLELYTIQLDFKIVLILMWVLKHIKINTILKIVDHTTWFQIHVNTPTPQNQHTWIMLWVANHMVTILDQIRTYVNKKPN